MEGRIIARVAARILSRCAAEGRQLDGIMTLRESCPAGCCLDALDPSVYMSRPLAQRQAHCPDSDMSVDMLRIPGRFRLEDCAPRFDGIAIASAI